MSDNVLTVIGGGDRSLTVTIGGSQAYQLAEKYRDDLQSYYDQNKLDLFDLFEDTDLSTETFSKDKSVGVISHGGKYALQDSKLNYLVAGKWNNTDLTQAVTHDKSGKEYISSENDPVTVNSAMALGRYVKVLVGIQNSFTYNAGLESGELVGGNSKNNIIFNGSTLAGANQATWHITTGDGDDTISTGASNDIVNAGAGKNQIILGTGNNSVYSYGQDTITSPVDGNGFNTITLYGGNSEVNVGRNSVVNDVSSNNTITVGGGSTVVGGQNSTVTFNEGTGASYFMGGVNDTVHATANNTPLQIVHGNGNKFDMNGDLDFFNGTGNVTINSHGGKGDASSQLFGADGLNLTFTSDVNDPTKMLVSGSFGGNETLDGSGSAGKLLIYADTTAGANTQLVGKGGSNDDTLAGGVGNTTLTGGEGADTFLFTNGSTEKGNTVITDFSKNQHDKISLMNFGYDNNNIQNLINSSRDENNNVIMKLSNDHTITIQGISKDQLDASDFSFWNDPKVVKNS